MIRVLGQRMSRMTSASPQTPIVVVLGATGAGKSQLALELSERFGGEIISSDAMQMYRGLDIVTNKVTEEEQARVQHHMINILDPLCHNNVVDFRNKALPVVERLLAEGRVPVICGGTNYYIESLLWKILVDDDLPFIVGGKRLIDKSDDGSNKSVKTSDLNENESEAISIESVDWSNDDNEINTWKLFNLLKTVDPERAGVLHPKERRKIWRSLQVFSRTGLTHSELLEKKGGSPESGFGGGLRFDRSRICIIEVWSEQSVLETRCDKRVEKMMARGLVKELQDFHEQFNKLRAEVRNSDMATLSYDKGIWQSIGFKEFHSYLCLSEEERETDEGKRLFSEGVQRMKISTRQYSRRQAKWIRRRFLTNLRDSPPVYRVDSSDPMLWKEKVRIQFNHKNVTIYLCPCIQVYDPAEDILKCFMSGVTPAATPVPRICEKPEREEDFRKTIHCDICKRDFKGDSQFRNHLKSKSHRRAVKAIAEDFEYELQLTEYNRDNKREVAKLIKDIFSIGISEVLENLEKVPYTLSRGPSLTKAKRISNELAKQDILTEVKRVDCKAEPQRDDTKVMAA